MAFSIDPIPATSADAVLSLETVKAHLSVETDDFDALLELYRDAAVEAVERYAGVFLRPVTGVVWRGDFPVAASGVLSLIDLARGPVEADGVTGIAYLDAGGSVIDLDPADWRVSASGSALAASDRWPLAWQAGSVIVTFNAGYRPEAVGDLPANLPRDLKQAVLIVVSYLWANRDGAANGSGGGELPAGARMLADRYRRVMI